MRKVEVWISDPTHGLTKRLGAIASPIGRCGFTPLVAVARRPASEGESDLMLDARFA